MPGLVRLMVGKELGEEYPFHPESGIGAEILRVEELQPRGKPHAVSFALHRGELLGAAGLVGSGRTELVRALFGADAKESGRIYRDGSEVSIRRPRDAVRHGICLLTEDRKAQGLILAMSCSANVTITDLRRVSHPRLLQDSAERSATPEPVDEPDIKKASVGQVGGNLSGGQQPKGVGAQMGLRRAQVGN